MRIVIAPDSFKGSVSAAEVAEALADGWRRVFPEADLCLFPMADGGEGTVAALVAATQGRYIEDDVTGPLGNRVKATYGLLGEHTADGQAERIHEGDVVVIEMASAAGLPLVPPKKRDPRGTTTRGLGELICNALEAGARRFIIGIGGSATNDGGAGMAQALGYKLLDTDGIELPPGGAALGNLARIDCASRHPGLIESEFLVACDVDNPLCGPRGATYVYGPQKGALPEMLETLDQGLEQFGVVCEAQLGVTVADVPGAGAAGGLGAGLIAFTGAQLRPGAALLAETCGLARHIMGADLVITGEGRLDVQTSHGKTPVGVASIAREHGVPVIAVAGALAPGHEAVYTLGIDAAFSICPGPISLDEVIGKTPVLLGDCGERIARVWKVARASE